VIADDLDSRDAVEMIPEVVLARARSMLNTTSPAVNGVLS
jgi:hypothetical protein